MACSCERNITQVVVKKPVINQNSPYENRVNELKNYLRHVPNHIKRDIRFQKYIVSILMKSSK